MSEVSRKRLHILGTSLCALSLCGGLLACSVAVPGLGDDDALTTGSLGSPSPLSPLFDGEDWRRAKAAMIVAIDPQGNGASTAWANPDSGLRGSFVSTSKPFVKADLVCRTFPAIIMGKRVKPLTLDATACRVSPDHWDIGGVKTRAKPS